MQDKIFMEMAIELAVKGTKEDTHPNPRVGAMVVDRDGQVIGTGFHHEYGQAHAEVEAIRSVEDRSRLRQSTLYVTLEPCSHFGKTPPCADLIVEYQIARVIIGSTDPNPRVSGNGIEKLKAAGVEVVIGVMEEECRAINPEFFTFHEQKRPYIILKWAQSADGYIDIVRKRGTKAAWMTGQQAKTLVHRWRAECDAIMVGRRTVEMDNPSLTVREVRGRNPLRVILDRQLQLHPMHNVFDAEAPTLIFTESLSKVAHAATCTLNYNAKNILPQLLDELYARSIKTLFVEGGAQTLASFIDNNLWDEARVFTSEGQILDHYTEVYRAQGVKAPQIDGQQVEANEKLRFVVLRPKHATTSN